LAPKLTRKSWVADSDAVRAVENTRIIHAEYTESRDSDTDGTNTALFTSRVDGPFGSTWHLQMDFIKTHVNSSKPKAS